MNYGGISAIYQDYNTSPIVILPVPYDGTTTWIKGADKGPEAILEASANMELYDIDTDSEVYLQGIHTAGPVTGNSSPEEMTAELYKVVAGHLANEKFIITLGGEHSVSIGAVKAYAEKYPRLSVLQIDAHTDLRPEYEGSSFNHACTMARIREFCPIVQVGIRSMDIVEKPFLQRDRIFFAKNISDGNKGWMDEVVEILDREVYVTIDLDGLDPSIMPSTGTPEPGGLNYQDVMQLIRKVIMKKILVGFDVVELCPNPLNKAPDFLASKLIYQILSHRFLLRQGK